MWKQAITVLSLKEMELLTLKDGRQIGDLIMMYKLLNNMEKIDRRDLISLIEGGSRWTRGHSKKIKESLRDIKKFCFFT